MWRTERVGRISTTVEAVGEAVVWTRRWWRWCVVEVVAWTRRWWRRHGVEARAEEERARGVNLVAVGDSSAWTR
jgi:hypothetical protein